MSESEASTEPDPSVLGDELVRFFRSLSADARREYAALAELDRRFGEDAAGELAAAKDPR